MRSNMKRVEQRRTRTLRCVQPFEGGSLCRTCGLLVDIDGLRRCSRLVVESAAMQRLVKRAAAIASSDASVVILGETGSGKEVIARLLHSNGCRRAGPFVAVNVAALPTELLESELFGHVRGAFTGAVRDKPGLFEEAHGGTLLLDEIAEMSPAMQAKLLRVLQEGEVRAVGDTRSVPVDVRILCATHRDLRAEVEQGRFREDLYYRLRVFTLVVPSLRERQADILPLAQAIAEQHARSSLQMTHAAKCALEGHPWPGNVRELANAMEHAVTLARGGVIDIEHLPDDVVSSPPKEQRGVREGAEDGKPSLSLAEVERAHILGVLGACGGNHADAARVLGIGRTTLWRKLAHISGPFAVPGAD